MKKNLTRFSATLFLSLLTFAFTQAQPGIKITPATALEYYLRNGDTVFHWEIKDTYEMGDVKAYALLFTSQKWREFTWKHQLTLFVPKEIKEDGALLFITGGSLKDGMPNWEGRDDGFFKSISQLATKNQAIVAVLRQTPNQPLFDDLSEDALISYTLHQFKNDNDYSWPLLFPMVKSAVRAMDAVQQFSKQHLNTTISRFIVSGASKRGWTTWLTGANDARVVGIAPMVIDILNMSVNLDYQIRAWHEYSVQIEDYVKLGIPQAAHTRGGNALNEMIDPYSYRKKLGIPKMIFMGTNDEYWVVDAIKNYYDSIPGPNRIHYVPNVGHDLGDGKSALEGLSAFFGITLNHQSYPECSWTVSAKNKMVSLAVKTSAATLVDAKLWSATSANMIFTKSAWAPREIKLTNKSLVTVTEAFPKSGFKAFYLDLKYKDPNGGEFTESTRMFVADKNSLKLH